jgi:hypothetical protein
MIKKYVNEEGLLLYGLCLSNVITFSALLMVSL